MRTELYVATLGLAERDQCVLHSLVKLLDGRLPVRLHLTDVPARADLWIASPERAEALAAQPPRAAKYIVARLLEAGNPSGAVPDADPWALSRPIGVTDLSELLRRAAETIDVAEPPTDAPRGQRALFEVLRLALNGDGAAVRHLRLGDGRSVLVDPDSNRVSSEASVRTLLGGLYSIESVAPASGAPFTDGAPHLLSALRLQWSLSHRLSGVSGVNRGGLRFDPGSRYRLRRWPDAEALAEPGYARLSALLSTRALNVAEAAQSSALPPAKVQRFIEAALACGIATVDAGGPAPVRAAAPAPAGVGLLQRLRVKLVQWSS